MDKRKYYLLDKLNYIRLNAEALLFEDMHTLAEGILKTLDKGEF